MNKNYVETLLTTIASVPGVKLVESDSKYDDDEYAWMERLPYPSDPQLCKAIIQKLDECALHVPSTYMGYLYGVVEDHEVKNIHISR